MDRIADLGARRSPSFRWLVSLALIVLGVAIGVPFLIVSNHLNGRAGSFFETNGDVVSIGRPSCTAPRSCLVTARVRVLPPGPPEVLPVQFTTTDLTLPRGSTVTVWASYQDRSAAYSNPPAPAGAGRMALYAGLTWFGLVLLLNGLAYAAYAARHREPVWLRLPASLPVVRLLPRLTLRVLASAVLLAAVAGWYTFSSVHAYRPGPMSGPGGM